MCSNSSEYRSTDVLIIVLKNEAFRLTPAHLYRVEMKMRIKSALIKKSYLLEYVSVKNPFLTMPI